VNKSLSIILILTFALPFLVFADYNQVRENDDSVSRLKRQIDKSLNGWAENRRIDNEDNPGYKPGTVVRTLGFEGPRAVSPGVTLNTTVYDLQTNATMPRMIGWRSNGMMHQVWTAKFTATPSDRYIDFAATDGDLGTATTTGNIEAAGTWSGYSALDVNPEGRALVSANYNGPEGFLPKIYYESSAGASDFNSNSHLMTLSETGMLYLTWPRIEMQVNGSDTVIHMLSEDWDNSYLIYMRHVGSDLSGVAWDYPPVKIDTIPTTGYVITAARGTQDVAIVWAAPPGDGVGNPESNYRVDGDPSLGSSQMTSDIYYTISTDMGASWSSSVTKENVTKYDSTVGGYLNNGDISALYDSGDKLNIVWNGRPAVPNGTSLGDWAAPDAYTGTVLGGTRSRLFHWDEVRNTIDVVSDADWDQSYCYGYDWNTMNMNKPMISECDGKLYVIWMQFNDVPFGIEDDCEHEALVSSPPDGGYSDANGELYLAVSDDGGATWGGRQNLTNSYSNDCTYPDCQSDEWPSMAKYGLNSAGLDFSSIPVVDPTLSYTGDYYLDVMYINDLEPGPYFEHYETPNPVKYFRLACVDPLDNQSTVMRLDDEVNIATLRHAIDYANYTPGPNTIEFGISGTIVLTGALPPLTDDNTTITGGGTIIIDGSGATGPGLEIQGSANHITGLEITGFPEEGILVSGGVDNHITNCTISSSGTDGIRIDGGDNTVIENNTITLNGDPTGDGIEITSGNGSIISNNTISLNTGEGINIQSGTQNTLSQNEIFKNNGGLGIDLLGDGVTPNDAGDGDTGPNDLLNFPVIDSVPMNISTHDFYVYGHADANSTIEFFVAHPSHSPALPADPSGYGEAYSYVGNKVCDGSGFFVDTITSSYPPYTVLTATATLSGNTSEFSHDFGLTPAPFHIVIYSPVNAWVTDPNGDYIGRDSAGNLSQTIVDATYPLAMGSDRDSVTISYPVGGEYTIVVKAEEGASPRAAYSVGIRIDGSDETIIVSDRDIPPAGDSDTYYYEVEEDWPYINGDANRDSTINIFDITYIISYLYLDGDAPWPEGAADANCDLVMNIFDITHLINYLYREGEVPCYHTE
jgi:parallel beta-helix repeat protein